MGNPDAFCIEISILAVLATSASLPVLKRFCTSSRARSVTPLSLAMSIARRIASRSLSWGRPGRRRWSLRSSNRARMRCATPSGVSPAAIST